jgi:hypothetical protein
MKNSALYFNELAAYAPHKVALVGHLYALKEDDPPFSRIALCVDGVRWNRLGDIDDIASSIDAWIDDSGAPKIIAMGRLGNGLLIGAKSKESTNIAIDPGHLFQVRYFAGNIYVCGSQRQVWRSKIDPIAWERIDNGLVVKRSKTKNPVFHTIHGVAPNCVYAGGRRGELFKFDGISWRKLDYPSNSDISRLEVLDSDDVIVCGKNGSLYRGHDDIWSPIGEEGYKEDFWSVSSLDGCVYASSLEDILFFKGGRIERLVRPNEDFKFHRISAADGYLWATGGEGEIARWNGQQWSIYLCPDN